MVRIIGGSFRGRQLKVPEGLQVRPTTDRVRETLFNLLAHNLGLPLHGARVLDLFAGAGTLGLEAVSRGAVSAVLVEKDRKIVQNLRQNAARFPGAQVVHKSVAAYLAGTPQQFNCIFLDPPYALGAVDATLATLAGGWLAEEGIICVEHPQDISLTVPTGLDLRVQRRYGITQLSFLEHAA